MPPPLASRSSSISSKFRIAIRNNSQCSWTEKRVTGIKFAMEDRDLIARDATLFVCPLCSLTFPERHDLQLHLPVHGRSGSPRVRVFACRICSKVFNSKAAVMLHLRSHPQHGPVPRPKRMRVVGETYLWRPDVPDKVVPQVPVVSRVSPTTAWRDEPAVAAAVQQSRLVNVVFSSQLYASIFSKPDDPIQPAQNAGVVADFPTSAAYDADVAGIPTSTRNDAGIESEARLPGNKLGEEDKQPDSILNYYNHIVDYL